MSSFMHANKLCTFLYFLLLLRCYFKPLLDFLLDFRSSTTNTLLNDITIRHHPCDDEVYVLEYGDSCWLHIMVIVNILVTYYENLIFLLVCGCTSYKLIANSIANHVVCSDR